MTKPWLQHYGDIADEVKWDKFASIRDIAEDSMTRFADKVAFSCSVKKMTYGDVDALSRDFAAYLQNELGLQKGERIAIMLPNILPFPVAMMGMQRAGLVQVNVNPLYTPRELGHQLRDSGAETIVMFNACTPTLAAVIDETPIKNIITVEVDDLTGFGLPSPAVHEALAGRAIRFSDALEAGKALELSRPEITHDDLAFLQYTGGTTGLSKGAMLSHGNILANMAQYEEFAGAITREGVEVVLTALPLYHVFALLVNCMIYFRYGGQNVLIPNPRDMDSFVADLQRQPITVMAGVNTLYAGLMMHPGIKDVDFSKLNVSWSGGTAMARATAEKWEELTGVQIREGYGLSETSPIVSMNPLSVDEFTGTIGIPFPMTEVILCDDDGNEVPVGEPGELWVRGPQVMQGYWNLPEATADAITPEGFFKTGDIATMSEDGFFKIVDRKKDMIIVSGFNVFPLEIEEVAMGIEGVVEAACVGVPDEKTGEAAKLFLAPKVEGLTAEAVIEHCRKNLTAYKVPRQIVFMDEIPKSTVGKILRREVREI